MIDAKKLSEIKLKLEKDREELLPQLKSSEWHEDFGSDVDPDEKTDEAESFSEQIAINQTIKERLSEIEIALNKILEMEYGFCENCAKGIEEEILMATPTARFCRNCNRNGGK